MRKFKWGKYGRRLIISVLKNKMEEFDKKNYAKVHSIETMGTVDGPGIRFVLFLQGCMLKCKYCHNRDTWSLGKGTIMSADELAKKVARYKNFLLPCGGGFTATGGEPLLKEIRSFPYEIKQAQNIFFDINLYDTLLFPISLQVLLFKVRFLELQSPCLFPFFPKMMSLKAMS